MPPQPLRLIPLLQSQLTRGEFPAPAPMRLGKRAGQRYRWVNFRIRHTPRYPPMVACNGLPALVAPELEADADALLVRVTAALCFFGAIWNETVSALPG